MNLFNYELFTGSKGNLLKFGDISKLVMGVVATVVATVLGQRILMLIENAIPGNQTKIEPFVKKQAIVTTNTAPVVERV